MKSIKQSSHSQLNKALMTGGLVFIFSAIIFSLILGIFPISSYPYEIPDLVKIYFVIPGVIFQVFLSAFEFFDFTYQFQFFIYVGVSSLYYSMVTFFIFLIRDKIIRVIFIVIAFAMVLALNAICWVWIMLIAAQSFA